MLTAKISPDDIHLLLILDTSFPQKWKIRSNDISFPLSGQTISDIQQVFQPYDRSLRKMDLSDALKNVRYGPLSTIEICITSECNLRCKHCYQGDAKLHQYRLEYHMLDQILADASDLGALNVTFSGGEVFCHPDFQKILLRAKELRYRIQIVTNGTLLSNEDFEILNNIEPYFVAISLDGFEEHHDFRRGKGTWKITVDTISRLIRQNINVRIIHSLDSRNIKSFPDFQKMLLSIGIKSIDILCIGNAGYATANKNTLFFNPEQYEALRDIFKSYDAHKGICGLFRMASLSINYNGDVYPCPMFRDLNINCIGNVLKTSLLDIFRDYQENYSHFRKLANGPTGCLKCNWFIKCRGKCRGRAEKAYGDINCPDPFACFVFGAKDSIGEHDNPNDLCWGNLDSR